MVVSPLVTTATKLTDPSHHTSYPFSPSIVEHTRLEGQHAALVDLMNRVAHAPISKNPSLLLDLGCGTGCVTTIFGVTYSTAEVIGVDRFPVSMIHDRPPNVHFVRGDIQHLSPDLDSRLVPDTADLAFGRLLALGITEWRAFISSLTMLTKPSVGYVELQELLWRLFDSDGLRIDESMEWMRALRFGLARKGLDPDAALEMPRRMEDVGLVDVQTRTYKWTVGPWLADREPRTRKMGEFNGAEMVGPISAILEEMVDKGEMGTRLQQEMREDLKGKEPGERDGVYFEFKVTTGRKERLT